MKKMIFAAAIAQEKRNDMPTQGMNTLAKARDYQAISDRLSRMEPQQAARWLSLQEEELRFAVACKMQPGAGRADFPLPAGTDDTGRLSAYRSLYLGKKQNFLVDGTDGIRYDYRKHPGKI